MSGSALQGQEPAAYAVLLCQADALRFLPGLSSISAWRHFPEAEPNSPHCRDSAGYGSSNFPPGFVNQSKAVVLLPLSLQCQGKAFQAGDLVCAVVYPQVRKMLSLVPSEGRGDLKLFIWSNLCTPDTIT